MNGRSLTLAAHYGVRREDIESLRVAGADSAIDVQVGDARIASGFAILRPFAHSRTAAARPLGLLFRLDAIEDLDIGGDRQAVIAGLIWEAGSRLSVALDYQEQTLDDQPPETAASRIAALDTRVWFLHAVASF